jgi:hypothetical protein
MMTVVAIAVFVVVVVVVWRGMSAWQTFSAQKSIEQSTITVPPGETYGIEGGASIWDGVLKVTVLKSAWYESYADAEETGDLGETSGYAPLDGPYVVCDVLLDASEATPSFGPDGILNVSAFRLLVTTSDVVILAESVGSDCMPASDDNAGIYAVALARGETTIVRLGFPLPEGFESSSVRLIGVDSLVQFALYDEE